MLKENLFPDVVSVVAAIVTALWGNNGERIFPDMRLVAAGMVATLWGKNGERFAAGVAISEDSTELMKKLQYHHIISIVR